MPRSSKRTAVSVIGAILELHPEIAEVTVFEPTAVPLAQQRLAGEPATGAIVEKGLRIREQFRFPFWDAVLVSCFGGGSTTRPVLEQACFHNDQPRRIITLPRTGWSNAALASIQRELVPGHMLVFRSRVRLANGQHGHIPMLDLHCPAPENLALARTAVALLDQAGYLLLSGKSFHYYGKSLLRDEELAGFLGRALLLSPIIDRAWVAHQLIEGACGLRISGKPDGGAAPTIIAELPA